MKTKRAICSWSGGKDSAYACWLAKQMGYEIVGLLNVMNETGQRSRSHGLPAEVLQQQAELVGCPIHLIESTWEDYTTKYIHALQYVKAKWNVDVCVFGDIDLEEHKQWEETVCKQAGLEAVLPLWKMDRRSLVMQMIHENWKTSIISCQAKMGIDFLGKQLNEALVQELEAIGVDPCGELGEFHTVVTDCKLFTQPMHLQWKEKEVHNEYCFIAVGMVK